MVRAEALERSGSLAAMRDALIDDCTLADRIKRLGRTGGGRLRLALTWRSHSIRPYPALADIWRMVARSAYTQLRHSPILLIGTLVGMALTYVAPPLLALTLPLHGLPLAAGLGAVAWGSWRRYSCRRCASTDSPGRWHLHCRSRLCFMPP